MNALTIMLFLGMQEWIIIILAILLLFGGKKIPELMRGLGQGIREFNSAKSDVKKHINDGINEDKSNPTTEKK